MNFFEHQHKARRKTGLLVVYFAIAVLLTVVVINVAIFAALKLSEPELAPSLQQWLRSGYWLWIALAVVVVILVGSIRALIKLSGGGRAVAKMVGARRIKMSSGDSNERRLINVVEEMSIASGTPVPALYVMDEEPGINAFVAGYRINQAVMVVTKGTLEQLSRDELQGVVGHEFSHILNGDMRLNVRLMATLAGILALGQLGGFMLRGMRFRSRGSGKSGNGGAILIIALILFVVGYVGLFFGRLIKAAVSRQREYLADASAVQFTRNPEGIAGALWKIGRATSRLHNAHAEDMSHMCFSSTLKLSSLLATHPPIDERIAAIDPYFSVKMTAKAAGETTLDTQKTTLDTQGATLGATLDTQVSTPVTAPAGGMAFAGEKGSSPVHTTPRQITASIGNPTEQHYHFAEQLHQALPASILNAAHDADTCRAVIYAMILMGVNTRERDIAAAIIKAHDGDDALALTQSLLPAFAELGTDVRLPVIDIVMPELQEMTAERREKFLGTVRALAQSDKRVTLFEFVLLTLLDQHLRDDADKPELVRYHKSDQVLNEIRILLTVLALAGRDRGADVNAAFQRVMKYFTAVRFEMADRSELKPGRLSEVFDKLGLLSPLVKQSVITACADLVVDDGKVLPAEAELLRATSTSLGCPMPPLLPL